MKCLLVEDFLAMTMIDDELMKANEGRKLDDLFSRSVRSQWRTESLGKWFVVMGLGRLKSTRGAQGKSLDTCLGIFSGCLQLLLILEIAEYSPET